MATKIIDLGHKAHKETKETIEFLELACPDIKISEVQRQMLQQVAKAVAVDHLTTKIPKRYANAEVTGLPSGGFLIDDPYTDLSPKDAAALRESVKLWYGADNLFGSMPRPTVHSVRVRAELFDVSKP